VSVQADALPEVSQGVGRCIETMAGYRVSRDRFLFRLGDFKRHRPDGTIDPVLKARYDKDSRELPRIIGSHARKLFQISLKEQEFEAVAPPQWREQFGTLNAVTGQMTQLRSAIGRIRNASKNRWRIL
jgi:hypothetical protein